MLYPHLKKWYYCMNSQKDLKCEEIRTHCHHQPPPSQFLIWPVLVEEVPKCPKYIHCCGLLLWLLHSILKLFFIGSSRSSVSVSNCLVEESRKPNIVFSLNLYINILLISIYHSIIIIVYTIYVLHTTTTSSLVLRIFDVVRLRLVEVEY